MRAAYMDNGRLRCRTRHPITELEPFQGGPGRHGFCWAIPGGGPERVGAQAGRFHGGATSKNGGNSWHFIWESRDSKLES